MHEQSTSMRITKINASSLVEQHHRSSAVPQVRPDQLPREGAPNMSASLKTITPMHAKRRAMLIGLLTTIVLLADALWIAAASAHAFWG